MYKKILVPLDGSELAECTLAHVKAIAKGCETSEVVLLSVVEKYERAGYTWGGVITEQQLREEAEEIEAKVAQYLKRIARDLTKEGLRVKTSVMSGTPTEEILDYARENDIDLIVMSSHGRSGPARWAMGSVADRVLRYSPVPVLIVSPKECQVSQD